MIDRRLFTAYFGLSACAVYSIPYFFAVTPSTSDSYVFGYSNRAGAGLLLALAFLGASLTRSLDFDSALSGLSPKVPWKVLAFVLTTEFCACVGSYLLNGQSRRPWEGIHIINRIYLLSLGKTPYVDFEFPFGPAFLYLPLWLEKTVNLNLYQSYAIIWTAASLVSLVMLYVVINLIDLQARNRTTIFLLFSFVAVLSAGNMGLNYTLLRYVSPLLSILVVYRAARQTDRLGGSWIAGGLAVFLSSMLLLISPEVAVSHIFACAVLLWPRKLASEASHWLEYGAILTAFGVLIAASYRLHLLDILFLSGGGANSFPIAFGPATLAYFGVAFFCISYAVHQWARAGRENNTIGIIAYSIPMCAAALGRCDPAHILFNGMGLFLVALLSASASGHWWRSCRNLFIACPLGLYVLIAFLATVIGLSSSKPRDFPPNGDIASLYSSLSKDPIRSRFKIPFSHEPNARGYFVSSQIDYGFFYGATDANTPQAIQRQIYELKNDPDESLLLPADFGTHCEVNEQQERIVVSVLLGFPYLARGAHPRSVREPLCDYIRAHYSLVEAASDQNFGYGLWMSR